MADAVSMAREAVELKGIAMEDEQLNYLNHLIIHMLYHCLRKMQIFLITAQVYRQWLMWILLRTDVKQAISLFAGM